MARKNVVFARSVGLSGKVHVEVYSQDDGGGNISQRPHFEGYYDKTVYNAQDSGVKTDTDSITIQDLIGVTLETPTQLP